MIAASATAPGRVNLIGEHTDYNGGYVLPIATPQGTHVAVRPRQDEIVRASSTNMPAAERTHEYALGRETRTGQWIDYVAGVTAAMREEGIELCGFEAEIASTLPLGGGLSSSASLEVALIRALAQACGLQLDPVVVARIAYRAETGLVGAPVGIMDQMAASLADTKEALFLDTHTLAYERLALPPSTALIVIHSGVVHRHAGGDYQRRREECERAARHLGVATLRDATPAMVAAAQLPAPLDRRARHVVTENERVLRARDALRAGDAATIGALMNASHVSMRDDFEVSTPDIDALVALMQSEAAVFGARLTGGGFGGSVVALAGSDAARATAQQIAAAYESRVSRLPNILIPIRH
jgi:galactokinase